MQESCSQGQDGVLVLQGVTSPTSSTPPNTTPIADWANAILKESCRTSRQRLSPSDGVHCDGSRIDKVGVEEHPPLRAVQLRSFYLIQAAVGPEHGSAQVVHCQPLGADEPCRGVRCSAMGTRGSRCTAIPIGRGRTIGDGPSRAGHTPELIMVSGSAPGSRLARLMVRPATSVQ